MRRKDLLLSVTGILVFGFVMALVGGCGGGGGGTTISAPSIVGTWWLTGGKYANGQLWNLQDRNIEYVRVIINANGTCDRYDASCGMAEVHETAEWVYVEPDNKWIINQGTAHEGELWFRNSRLEYKQDNEWSYFVKTETRNDNCPTTVGTLEKIEPLPGGDFAWPYYLYTPSSVSQQTETHLLVMPNNTGYTSDDPAVHEEAARQLIMRYEDHAEKLGAPLLVPTFPRPHTNWRIYTHALDRDTLLTDDVGLQRIDLQLIAMIDDARDRLGTAAGTAQVSIAPQILMDGFSASGMFVNRFAVLHPELVEAAAVGSPGGWPIAPVSEWEQETLRYPIGVADLNEVAGEAFQLEAFRSVPLLFYIGDADTNDSVPYTDGYDPVDKELVFRLFGETPLARWPIAEQIYQAAGCSAQFVTYPGVGHEVSPQMTSDVEAFLKSHM